MEGKISNDIARLTHLLYLDLLLNHFSGVLPHAIYSFSLLEYLSIFSNGFSPKFRELYIGNI